MLLPVYAVDDEGLEKDGAVVGFAGEFVDHASDGVLPAGGDAGGGVFE